MHFELLDHPADIGFRAVGSSIEELFVHCAQALVYIILDPSKIELTQHFALSTEGIDYESLLSIGLMKSSIMWTADAWHLAHSRFHDLVGLTSNL